MRVRAGPLLRRAEGGAGGAAAREGRAPGGTAHEEGQPPAPARSGSGYRHPGSGASGSPAGAGCVSDAGARSGPFPCASRGRTAAKTRCQWSAPGSTVTDAAALTLAVRQAASAVRSLSPRWTGAGRPVADHRRCQARARRQRAKPVPGNFPLCRPIRCSRLPPQQKAPAEAPPRRRRRRQQRARPPQRNLHLPSPPPRPRRQWRRPRRPRRQ